MTWHAFLRPFYDPETFSWKAVSTGTSIAMLTYIGFDGISTLSEEAHNPRRNIMLATVLTCLMTGILAASQVYAAQLVWPQLLWLSRRRHGVCLTSPVRPAVRPCFSVNLALLVATIGSGVGSHLARAGCFMVWGATTPFPAAFSARSTPARDPKQQHPARRRACAGCPRHELSTRSRAAEFRRVHRLHGREPRGFHAIICA